MVQVIVATTRCHCIFTAELSLFQLLHLAACVQFSFAKSIVSACHYDGPGTSFSEFCKFLFYRYISGDIFLLLVFKSETRISWPIPYSCLWCIHQTASLH